MTFFSFVYCIVPDEISAHQTITTMAPTLLFPAKVENDTYKYEHRYKLSDFVIEKKLRIVIVVLIIPLTMHQNV